MENKIYRFNELFMLDEIRKAKQILQEGNIDSKTKQEIILMLKKFYEYLNIKAGSKLKKDINATKKIPKKILYEDLQNKLNNDLEKIGVDFWAAVKTLYNNIDHYKFDEKDDKNIVISDTKMINLILEFYKNLDEEYYKIASDIVNSPFGLINFDENGNQNDHFFVCEYLKLPFINIKSNGNKKYMAFIHELQHSIDYIINDFKVFGLYRELAPMFFETIFIDVLNSFNSSEGLYNIRINDHINTMEWLNEYINALLLFDKLGRKIDKHNISLILGSTDKKHQEYKLRKFMKNDFIDYLRYTISFLRAIELREEYYNGDIKTTIKKLKDNMSGRDNNIDFYNCIRCYNNFIKEIKEKNNINEKNVK